MFVMKFFDKDSYGTLEYALFPFEMVGEQKTRKNDESYLKFYYS